MPSRILGVKPRENLLAERMIPPGGADRGSPRKTVFIVDDEEMVRTVAAELLRHLGYDVDMASSGEEAVARIEGGARPDCILLDIVMPGIGGAEALRQIHALAPGIRIVISSGFTDRISAEALADEGASAIISKPYRMEALGSRLKEILG
jgi:two-component system, cell cycle sensor histidine kinase and response regulator CckA